MKTLLPIVSIATLLALPGTHSSAQDNSKKADTTLVRYDFSRAEEPIASNQSASGLEASKLSFGQTIAEAFEKSPPAASFSPDGELSIRSDALPQGVSAEGEHYIEFTLEAPAGKRIEVTGISVTGRRSGNEPAVYAYPKMKSSFDDFNTVIGVGQIKSKDFVTLQQVINGLTVEGSVTFRLFLPAINRGSVRVILSDISVSGQLL